MSYEGPWGGGNGGGGGGAGGTSIVGSLTTPSGAPTLVTWGAGDREVALNSVERVAIYVVGRDPAGVERVTIDQVAQVYRNGGAAALGAASPSTSFNDETNAGTAANIVLTGNDIDVEVTGIAGTPLVWGVILSRGETTSPQIVVQGVAPGPDYNGLYDDDANVILSDWTDMDTIVAIANVEPLTDLALQGATTQHKRIRFTPILDGAAVKVSGVLQAVPDTEWRRGVNLELEWGFAAANAAITGSTDFRIGFVFLDVNGENLRGLSWEIDAGFLATEQTFIRVVGNPGTIGANDVVTSAWDAVSILMRTGIATVRTTMWLQRNADSTIGVWCGLAGMKPMKLFTNQAAIASAGYVGVVCYTNAGIDPTLVPTIAIASQLAAPAALPWVV